MAILFAALESNLAFVATTPIVVFCPGRVSRVAVPDKGSFGA